MIIWIAGGSLGCALTSSLDFTSYKAACIYWEGNEKGKCRNRKMDSLKIRKHLRDQEQIFIIFKTFTYFIHNHIIVHIEFNKKSQMTRFKHCISFIFKLFIFLFLLFISAFLHFFIHPSEVNTGSTVRPDSEPFLKYKCCIFFSHLIGQSLCERGCDY